MEATIEASQKYLSAPFVFSFYDLKNGMSHDRGTYKFFNLYSQRPNNSNSGVGCKTPNYVKEKVR